jgi:hypothetical protein
LFSNPRRPYPLLFCGLALALGALAQWNIARSPQLPAPDLWFLYLAAALLFFLATFFPAPGGADPLSPKCEWSLFLLLMSLAAFYRIYRLGSLPPGLFVDQGFEGWSALRILHEGYRPWWEYGVFQNPALLLYQLAGWFFLVPAGRFTFLLFFALMSLATLPLVYLTFRQLAGPRAALCALFFLAVMRWNVNFSRNGFPTLQVPFYIFGTLAFLLLGLKAGKRWPFYLSACFLGLGLYTYQSYQAFFLWLLPLGFYALFCHRPLLAARWKSLLGFLALGGLLSLPFLRHSLALRGLGSRETEVSILSKVKEAGNWSPLWENLRKTALMFHWQGDTFARHNLPLHRMLDDGTGILFFFGLVMALLSPWKKASFFALTGFFAMSLPGVLSINPAHANRLLGLTPLIALLAALPCAFLWERAAGTQARGKKMFLASLAALALAAIAWQNFDLYFRRQAADLETFEEYDSEETFAAQKTAQYGGAYDLYFSPYYDMIYSIRFLSYFHRDHFHLLKVPEDLACPPGQGSLGKGFFLEPDREGLYALLKSLYPQGQVEDFLDPEGNLSMRLYLVSPGELAKKKDLSPRQLVPRGLKGFYYDNPEGLRSPVLVHDDPLVNFSNEGSFPRQCPLIRWKGTLEVPRPGRYGFSIATWSEASLFLDGQERISEEEENGSCYLAAGAHTIEVVFRHPEKRDAWCLNLSWLKPGALREEVIPNGAFGVLKGH